MTMVDFVVYYTFGYLPFFSINGVGDLYKGM